MTRSSFKQLMRKHLKVREPDKDNEAEYVDWAHGMIYLYHVASKRIVAKMQSDHLFDGDGNRFDYY